MILKHDSRAFMKFLAFSLLFFVFAAPAGSQTPKSKPAAARSKGASTTPRKSPVSKLSERSEWESSIAKTDNAERAAALKKFIAAFPASAHLAEASSLLASAEASLASDKLTAGDLDAAAALYKSAAADAPSPVPAETFELLAKAPANLYFRGARDAAIEIAATLEQRSAADAAQLLGIAQFYLSIESGSEAKRLAEAAIKLAPDSAEAYQALGLANRMDFQLEDSAAAYAKALELKPDSVVAKRGLAEMYRSLGKSEEAIALYREIVSKDEADMPAKTGLVLAQFDAGDRTGAEAAMSAALDAAPGNVMLLAGAAYWYAAHNEPDRAVQLAQKALDADPRFIWSHIALARGLLGQKKALEAERVLLAARRYGNFPTLEYEIASARLAAGLYRDAADELAKSFAIKDGVIQVNLGGRVPRQSQYFTELVGFERRASIFAPTAADDPDSAAQLAALLQLRQETDRDQPDAAAVVKAVDDLVRGTDAMKVYRQLYAANLLLERHLAADKALDLVRSAPQNLDAGLKVPDAVTPVLAGELYESRRIALERGEFLNRPAVPAATLSAVLRGRVEDIMGWAMYESNDTDGAVVHLRRAVSVLPADSSWWRTANWRLGNALLLAGKDAEALETYIKTYRSGAPDPIRYAAIESLYKRVKGSADGLDAQIGQNPAAAVAQAVPSAEGTPPGEAAATPNPEAAAAVDAAVAESTRLPEPAPSVADKPVTLPPGVPVAIETARQTPEADKTPAPAEITPEPAEIPSAPAEITPAPAEITPDTAEITPEPAAATDTPAATPDVPDGLPSPEPSSSVEPVPEATADIAAESPPISASPTASPDPTAVAKAPTLIIQNPTGTEAKRELFPPVIISIPPPAAKPVRSPSAGDSPAPSPTPAAEPAETPTLSESEAITPTEKAPADDEAPVDPSAASPSPSPTPADESPAAAPSPTPSPSEALPTPSASPVEEPLSEAVRRRDDSDGRPRLVVTDGLAKTCALTASEESINLRSGGGEPLMIGREDESEDLEGLTAVSTSPENVTIRRENIEGIIGRAIFVVRSVSARPGVYQLRFELPCGRKNVVVRVR